MSSKKLCKHSKLGRSIEKALYQPRTKCRFLRVQALTTSYFYFHLMALSFSRRGLLRTPRF